MKCTIQSQKKQAVLTIKKLTLYQRCKIIHAKGRSGADYYLIFHKDRYINTAKINHLKDDGFIKKAFSNGLVIKGAHPAIYKLVNDHVFMCTRMTQTINKFKQRQPNLEQVITLTYFDQFITKDELINAFIDCFRDYRRKGNIQKAYNVLSVLKHYDPNNQFAKEMLASMTFQGYQSTYKEYFYYTPLDPQRLYDIFTHHERSVDLSILVTYRLLNRFSLTDWNVFQNFLSSYPKEVQANTTFQLFKQKPALIKYRSFTDVLLTHANTKQFFKIVFNDSFPHDLYQPLFIKHMENASEELIMEVFNNKYPLQEVIKDFPINKQEQAIRPMIEIILKHTSIHEVLAWLENFKHTFSFQSALEQIKQLEENPDKQDQLGDLYKMFNDLDHAISCYKWVIEFNPNHELTLKKLITLLKQNGQNEEAEAYQQQFIQQNKYSS
ncbi:tetratricopeptide repeat protein [Amphibacillus jilinensis]|uniref:tetratricopeptide repeat protein n=1 Tax=Amphibacillus jilinensis TaxID=1216008 RepID=UPI0003030B0F|nr:hypothetical protein [Amphibacillus jilinensis]